MIALTSFAMVGDRENALSAGCDEYLPKPIDIQGLKSMVARFLEPPQAAPSRTQSLMKPETGKVDPAHC